MFRGETANYTDIASKLNDNATWLSHDAVVSAENALTLGFEWTAVTKIAMSGKRTGGSILR